MAVKAQNISSAASTASRPSVIFISSSRCEFIRTLHCLPRRGRMNSALQAIADHNVLGLEFESRSLRLQYQQLRKVLFGHAAADQRLDDVAGERGQRHRHFETAPGIEAEVEILAQQMRRERDLEIQVDERRRLVAR